MPEQQEARLLVKVRPNASRDEVVGLKDDTLEVKVAAPPVEGKANQAVVALLAASLGLARSRVTVIKGHRSRTKQVAIAGLDREEVLARLRNCQPASYLPGRVPLEPPGQRAIPAPPERRGRPAAPRPVFE